MDNILAIPTSDEGLVQLLHWCEQGDLEQLQRHANEKKSDYIMRQCVKAACATHHWGVVEWLMRKWLTRSKAVAESGKHVSFHSGRHSHESNDLGLLQIVPVDASATGEHPIYNWFGEVCEQGDVAVFQHVVDVLPLPIPAHSLEYGFITCCEHGHLSLVQDAWWTHSVTIGPLLRKKAFMRACVHGQLEMARWLYASAVIILEPGYEQHTCFGQVCANGHLSIAQWLLRDIIPDVNVRADNEYSFRHACLNGHLNVAQWLLQQQQQQQPLGSLSTNNHCYAFVKACELGHLTVAQWLLLQEPLMELDNDTRLRVWQEAARKASVNGYVEVVQWLLGMHRLDQLHQLLVSLTDNPCRNNMVLRSLAQNWFAQYRRRITSMFVRLNSICPTDLIVDCAEWI